MDFDLDSEEPAMEVMGSTFGLSKIQQAQIDFKRYEAVVAEMKTKAAAITITDKATDIQAVEMIGQAAAMAKAIENKREELVKSPNEFVKAVNQFAKPYTDGLAEIKSDLGRKHIRFAQEEEKKRLESQRKAKEEAAKVYNNLGTKYGVAQVPTHSHNGIDSTQLTEDVITLTNKLNTQLQLSNATGSPDSGSFTLRNVSNVSRISFHGYTANNASGAATKRAVITGEVIFGRCYTFTGSGSSIAITTQSVGEPFRQACDYMFVDTASINNTRVGTAPNLAFATDSAPATVASLTLVGYSNGNLLFDYIIGAQYTMQGNIIIE